MVARVNIAKDDMNESKPNIPLTRLFEGRKENNIIFCICVPIRLASNIIHA